MPQSRDQLTRRLVHVSGVVQGVGFRPFVHALSNAHRLTGMVRNRGGAVEIEVQGSGAALASFLAKLAENPPAGARIDRIVTSDLPPRDEMEFVIADSDLAEAADIALAPDTATCDSCLADVEVAASRWQGYPFTSCCSCGPRFTIARAAPFDRERTTMDVFPLCAECHANFADPRSRRFHAQTIACRQCGPAIAVDGQNKRHGAGSDPFVRAATWIREGKIGAVKGISGYHLFCDATNAAAVAELRRRKRRHEKPLAVMVANLDDALRLCEISEAEELWLRSPARPIVLLRNRPNSGLAAAVSAGAPHTGVMLPYSALHYLLLKATAGRPLVMTSGNAANEPTAFRDEPARQHLAGIADFFLTHDREIVSRCDDSVIRFAGAQPIFLRRSRGYAPTPLPVPFGSAAPTLAVGGQLKTTFSLGQTNRAILSHHIGDLDDYETWSDYEQSIAHYERLFRIRPELLVHDLHPDYASTRYALGRATRDSVQTLAVQHHHAHFASCLADAGELGPAIGVCFDGTGYGTDGAIWGGEFLVGDCRQVERAAHLRYTPMPGGEKAIREPWRMAAAYLLDAELDPAEWLPGIPPAHMRFVSQMISKRINVPQTSSVGRFFDAMAALLQIRRQVAYEGQAAVELEALALDTPADATYVFSISPGAPMIADLRPVVQSVVDDLRRGVAKTQIAARLHATLASLIETICSRLAARSGLKTVALSGGVFMNAILLEQSIHRLERAGFRVLRHVRVPPNDGGLCLGQLAVAAAQI